MRHRGGSIRLITTYVYLPHSFVYPSLGPGLASARLPSPRPPPPSPPRPPPSALLSPLYASLSPSATIVPSARTGTLSSSPCTRKHLVAIDLKRANPSTAKQPIISLQRYASPRPADIALNVGMPEVPDESGEKRPARLHRRRCATL